jgi:predicted transcriptional regulator
LPKKGRNNILSEAKEAICYIANKELGLSATKIGLSLGISQPAVSKYVDRVDEKRRKMIIKLLS